MHGQAGSVFESRILSNNGATFSLGSATSGGTIGVLPSLDFYTGTVTTSIPASSSVVYQIPVPPEGKRHAEHHYLSGSYSS